MKSTNHVYEIAHGKVLEVDLHGKLSREDYEKVVPEIDRQIRQYGKIHVLVTMREFEGWDAGALWEDLKWETKHFSAIERLAVVGEEPWHKWMAGFCNAFSRAEVRYFTFAEMEEAHAWISP